MVILNTFRKTKRKKNTIITSSTTNNNNNTNDGADAVGIAIFTLKLYYKVILIKNETVSKADM